MVEISSSKQQGRCKVMSKIYNTGRAWNLVTAEVQEKYVGKKISFLKSKGRIIEFNDFGVLITWEIADPNYEYIHVGTEIYPNISGTLALLRLEDENV
jgi:hypothetical protein